MAAASAAGYSVGRRDRRAGSWGPDGDVGEAKRAGVGSITSAEWEVPGALLGLQPAVTPAIPAANCGSYD